ncbi:MAG: hypothetical protein R3Y23_02625 [Bacillota bacterium]
MEQNVINDLVESINEQTETKTAELVAEATETATTGVEDSFGKFKSKEQLISAYNSLEAEFTRRSQRIKELETAVNKQSEAGKWEQRVNELASKYPIAKEMSTELMDYLKEHRDIIKQENCLETALLHTLASRQMNGVKKSATSKKTGSADANNINQLIEVQRESVPLIAKSVGETPLVKPIIPRSISEAGSLAIQMIGKK